MVERPLIVVAVLIPALAVLFTFFNQNGTKLNAFTEGPKGKNNTVLFLANYEYGLANVLLASSHALLVHHPEVKVHYASFPKREKDTTLISKFAQQQNPSASPITFHEFKGPSYGDVMQAAGHYIEQAIHPPGVKGGAQLCANMQQYLMPWNGSEYHGLYKEALRIIDEVDPAVVALDGIFGPGLDATKARGRRHAVVSPNSLRDSFADKQPMGAMFWKYPAMGSGFPYPVPWSKIPANIFMNIRFIYSVLATPDLAVKKKYLRSKGIAKPNDFFSVYNEHMTWICSSSVHSDFPVTVVPPNVKPCGPIFLSTATAEEQDPELAAWLAKAPTLLINLGSVTDYNELRATEMARAIQVLLDKTDVQVLWKFNKRVYADKRAEFSADFLGPLRDNPRLRMEKWIKIDPAAMMKTGNIVASVHHGGANCYHEAIGMGVPQIVLPAWVDLYDYATRAEYLGVGVWGNKLGAPDWSAEELSEAFLRVLGGNEEAAALRKKAKDLSEKIKGEVGSEGSACSARHLAELAIVKDED